MFHGFFDHLLKCLNMKLSSAIPVLWLLLICTFGCRSGQSDGSRFAFLTSKQSGVEFVNAIRESDALNILEFANLYTGGGVACGDFDKDGFDDLFFAGNVVSSELYLNRKARYGELRFEKVTAEAGLQTSAWVSGVTAVDINQDGWLDLYLCVNGSKVAEKRANLLFVNQGLDKRGIPVFREEAAAYGLADTSYTMQAVFFDLDLDFDLDVLMIVNYPDYYYGSNVNIPVTIPKVGLPYKVDRLYRNEGLDPSGQRRFVEIGKQAGIQQEGYSLGVAVSDLNNDRYPDIYITNDYLSSDLLYLNQGDGTFVERAASAIQHASYAAMGVDVSDLNNDARPDIVSLDMLPPDNLRAKKMIPKGNPERFQLTQEMGYLPQYSRNTLQLQTGLTAEGCPQFSEIGQLAGIHQTDWSWSVLAADLDNDTDRDMYITNGFPRDLGDLDFINFGFEDHHFNQPSLQDSLFLAEAHRLPGIHLSNFLFLNQGDLHFEDQTRSSGLHMPSYSNGCVVADLDNDGDLDIAVNNINEPAFIIENQSANDHHYLQLELKGPPGNLQGIGTKIEITTDRGQQFHQQFLSRGYLSSQPHRIHFGLGPDTIVRLLTVNWPDGRQQKLHHVPCDQMLKINHANSSRPPEENPILSKPLFAGTQKVDSGLNWIHREQDFVDFHYQRLLPRMHSISGPGAAVADFNGDGLDDFCLGGAAYQSAQLFVQTKSGSFQPRALDQTHAKSEDQGMLFFDAEGDADLDLYIVSGGAAFSTNSPLLQDRLYVNEGQGRFRLSSNSLPPINSSGSCVVGADYDRDGDLDLFVGGRVVPGKYPTAPRSYLLRNDSGRGGSPHFEDVSDKMESDLSRIGMVTAAIWTDYNDDQWMDLIIVGEWMAITFFRNDHGNLVAERPAIRFKSNGEPARTEGWWSSITGGDFDLDGDTDYVVGNLGLNSKFRASEEHPVRIYGHDFDENGSLDPVLTHYVDGLEVPVHYRDELMAQLVYLRGKFPRYSDYAAADLVELLGRESLVDAEVLEVSYLQSAYLENRGEAGFWLEALPTMAQFAPVKGVVAGNFDRDQYPDLIIVGNDYGAEAVAGRYDAAKGCYLRGNGDGSFTPLSSAESGLSIGVDSRALVRINSRKSKDLLVAVNNDKPRYFQGPDWRSDPIPVPEAAVCAFLTLANGKQMKMEFYRGSGYLSQSSNKALSIEQSLIDSLEFIDANGEVMMMN